MFFKKSENQQKAATDNGRAGNVAAVAAVQHDPLPVTDLRKTVDPAALGFRSTSELEPISGLIGQDRALKAIDFGASMNSHDFNIFVLGPPASGKSTAVSSGTEMRAGVDDAVSLQLTSIWVVV